MSNDFAIQFLEARLFMSVTPNDPDYGDQYALPAIGAPAAWDVTKGSTKVVVADIDTGMDYTHPDLYLNVWINQAEIPRGVRKTLVDTDGDKRITFYDLNAPANAGRVRDNNKNGHVDAGDILRAAKRGGWSNGVDEGKNGYTDDLIGWDFSGDDNNPASPDGHGTHTAGTIGAVGNNGRGVSGVVWRTQLMAVKIFDDDGESVSDRAIAAAIRYSAANGARVSNNSWGGGDYSAQIYKAIQFAGSKGQTFVTAAGNDSANLDSGFQASYPAEYELNNIISVGATGTGGRKASYSDYGQDTVDVFAPGSQVLSTTAGGGYEEMTGTSMSTPLVTGAVALMLSANSKLTPAKIRSRIIKGADQSTSLIATSVSNGELNVANAIANVAGERVDQDSGGSGGGGFPFPFPPRPRFPFSVGAGRAVWDVG